jgi:non-ribosomal peptide synthetase component E (peptide arylation enzyme)
MFLGYLDPALNEWAFSPDGWFRTGDVGSLDPSGSLTVRGRLKDVIIRGGENITPVEVEQLLTKHPSVLDAAVVAMPDPVYGERACAFVVTDDPSFDMEAMLGHLRSFRIASFKLPERLEVRRQLPSTSTGKVRKDVLREEIAALLEQEATRACIREETT